MKIEWKEVCATAIVSLITLGNAALPAAHAAQLTCSPAGQGMQFGMHIHKLHDPRFVKAGEFESWRLWDSGVTWRYLQPKEGEWDFRRLDLAVALAQKLGVTVGITLGSTPAWASARPDERGMMGPGSAAEPKDLALWDQYVEAVARRYRGRMAFYEVWNEPASSGFYTGSIPTLVEMARRAYAIVKRVDPAAIVVSPSPAKAESLPWMKRYLEAGGGEFADVFGYHLYTDSAYPEKIVDLVRGVQEVLRPRYPMMPLWNTESGLRFTPAAAEAETTSSTVPDSASHVARWLVLASCLGVERFYYYAWDDGNYGLVDRESALPTSTLAGWDAGRKWLAGSRLSQCKESDGIWDCALASANGHQQRILWSTRGPMPLAGTLPRGAILEDIHGARSAADPERIRVSSSPVRIDMP